jgi:hypothetical protein
LTRSSGLARQRRTVSLPRDPYRPDISPPPWIGYTIYGAEPLAYLGVILLALGFAVVSLSRPRRSTNAVTTI